MKPHHPYSSSTLYKILAGALVARQAADENISDTYYNGTPASSSCSLLPPRIPLRSITPTSYLCIALITQCILYAAFVQHRTENAR